jgi:hypothetical protein
MTTGLSNCCCGGGCTPCNGCECPASPECNNTAAQAIACNNANSCNYGTSYRTGNSSSTWLGTCALLSTCTLGTTFEWVAPTWTTNRFCSAVTSCAQGSTYETGQATLTSDTRCSPVTSCVPGRNFQSTPPTLTSDRACDNNVTHCDLGVNYQSEPPTLTSDRRCGNTVTNCTVGVTYQYVPPTLTTDRVCTPDTRCDLGVNYQSEPPTITTDRVCGNLVTSCAPDSHQTQSEPPTLTSDRVCVDIWSASPSDLPTAQPSLAPIARPTFWPTSFPTYPQTSVPTAQPRAPTSIPTMQPSSSPRPSHCQLLTDDCDPSSTVCTEMSNATLGYSCACKQGFFPISGVNLSCSVSPSVNDTTHQDSPDSSVTCNSGCVIAIVGIVVPLIISCVTYGIQRWRAALGCNLMVTRANGNVTRCKLPVKPGKKFCRKHLCNWCEVEGTTSADVWCNVCDGAHKEHISNERVTQDRFDNPAFAAQYEDVDDDVPFIN